MDSIVERRGKEKESIVEPRGKGKEEKMFQKLLFDRVSCKHSPGEDTLAH